MEMANCVKRWAFKKLNGNRKQMTIRMTIQSEWTQVDCEEVIRNACKYANVVSSKSILFLFKSKPFDSKV